MRSRRRARLDLDRLGPAILREQLGPIDLEGICPKDGDLFLEPSALFVGQALGIEVEDSDAIRVPALAHAGGQEMGELGDLGHGRWTKAEQDLPVDLVALIKIEVHERAFRSKTLAQEIAAQLDFDPDDIAGFLGHLPELIVEADADLAACPGEGATLIAERFSADVLVPTVPMRVDE